MFISFSTETDEQKQVTTRRIDMNGLEFMILHKDINS